MISSVINYIDNKNVLMEKYKCRIVVYISV